MAERFAVITGAGTGIGRASALALMNDGWSVALAGRRRGMLEENRQLEEGGQCPGGPGRRHRARTGGQSVCGGQVGIRSDRHAVQRNAGAGTPTTNFGDFTYEMWLNVVQVNLNAMFLCANAGFRMMRDQEPHGGRIINNRPRFRRMCPGLGQWPIRRPSTPSLA